MFQSREKEIFRKMLAQVADFSGVEVLTYCVMNNHFHVLVRVPVNEPVSDQELLRRYQVLYPQPTKYQTASIGIIAQELQAGGEAAEKIRAQLLARMHDVSQFMKTLKQRFSTWYNKTYDRYGPLWSDRFKSVLVEGKGHPLQTMAAYIDLNPVRAGLVDDPKDYRFCGYAEAVAGQEKARNAYCFLTSGLYSVDPEEALATYRQLLFGKGAAPGVGREKIDEKRFQQTMAEQGKLPAWTLLRCRVRYFTEGAILGSNEFVRSYAKEWQRSRKQKFPPKLRSIAFSDEPDLTVIKGIRNTFR